jgi:hypothetical protein
LQETQKIHAATPDWLISNDPKRSWTPSDEHGFISKLRRNRPAAFRSYALIVLGDRRRYDFAASDVLEIKAFTSRQLAISYSESR